MVGTWRTGPDCRSGKGRGGGEAAVGFGGAEEEGYVAEIDYLLLIKKPHLPRRHARILVQIRPGRVDDRDVVFLIACAEPINQISHHQSLSSISCILGCEPGRAAWIGEPSIEFALVNCAHSSTSSLGNASHVCSGASRR